MAEIKTDLECVDWEQLTDLYEEVGLIRGFGKSRNSESIKKAFENSFRIVTAWDQDRIVGAGRMISDGICYGMIFDIGVLPEYQGKGIGKGLMNELLKDNDELCVHLTSTFGNENFYKKLGFRKHKTAYARYPLESDYLE